MVQNLNICVFLLYMCTSFNTKYQIWYDNHRTEGLYGVDPPPQTWDTALKQL